MRYSSFFVVLTVLSMLIPDGTFCAAESNKSVPASSQWLPAQFATLRAPSYAMSLFGLGCCIASLYIYKQFSVKPLPKIRHDDGERVIPAAIQREANQFLTTYYNYLNLKKAVSSTVVQESKREIEKHAYYHLIPLLGETCFNSAVGRNQCYSVTLPSEKLVAASKRFTFMVKNGTCVAIHIDLYEGQADRSRQLSVSSAGGSDGYRSLCRYPENASDNEYAFHLDNANALVQAKKEYDAAHAAWQEGKEVCKPQPVPWDVQLYAQLFTALNEIRCKGLLKGKDYCVRGVCCEARDIVAAYKEYELQIRNGGKAFTKTDCQQPVAAGILEHHKASWQAHAALYAVLVRTPFSVADFNTMKVAIEEKNKVKC